jgi:hypothetical protein
MHIWNRIAGTVGGRLPVVAETAGRIRIGDDVMLGMPAWMLDGQARAEFFVAEMDAAGVAAGVVVQEYLDGPQNDYLLETAERFPGRFFVHALPDLFQPDRAADEAVRLFERGFRGMKLSAMHLVDRVALDDARLTPAYRHMEKNGLVLAVDLAADAAQCRQMRAVLEACPQLRVAIGHFGMPTRGGWPDQLELARYPNVHIETGGIVWLYRDQGYPFPGAVDAVRRAVDTVGIEKVMWGSDWPRTMVDFTYRQSLDFISASARFTNDELRAILAGNASRLYGLAVAEPAPPRLSLVTEG